MLTIRLSRTGKHKAPQYRIVVQDKMRDPWSPAIEILGHLNPRKTPSDLVLNKERAAYWLSKGAQTSGTVHNILVDQGLIKKDKKASVNISKKRTKKMGIKKEADEKAKAEAIAKAEAAKEAEAAAKVAAAEAEKAAAEAAKEAAAAEKATAEAAAAAPEIAAEAPVAEEAPAAEAAPEAAAE
jgi:small subunit ribosomal protein S16